MSIKAHLTLACAAALFAFATPALALNPQPEPPMPYRGYDYVLRLVQPNEWRWVVERRPPGRSTVVLDSGVAHGGHGQAVAAARAAVDRIVAADRPANRPATAPAGTRNRP